MTARVTKNFQCWIERDRGNALPSKYFMLLSPFLFGLDRVALTCSSFNASHFHAHPTLVLCRIIFSIWDFASTIFRIDLLNKLILKRGKPEYPEKTHLSSLMTTNQTPRPGSEPPWWEASALNWQPISMLICWILLNYSNVSSSANYSAE